MSLESDKLGVLSSAVRKYTNILFESLEYVLTIFVFQQDCPVCLVVCPMNFLSCAFSRLSSVLCVGVLLFLFHT